MDAHTISFNDLPIVVGQIGNRLDSIEKLLQSINSPASTPKQSIRFTLPEAADYCRMAVPTFRVYLRKREVGGCKLGKAWLFTREDLDTFLAKYRTMTAEQVALKSETILRRPR